MVIIVIVIILVVSMSFKSSSSSNKGNNSSRLITTESSRADLSSENDADEPMDNWRQFQGTELGSLLGSIYGAQKPKINYPKPKLQRNVAKPQEFIPGGASIHSSDPRKSTRRQVDVAVPKLTGGRTLSNQEIQPIDIIPRRKSADVIQVELDEIRLRQERYRPANVIPISSDTEKDRLSQIFTFKGGKGLPEELTMPVGDCPFEVIERKKERARLDAIRVKRGLAVVSNTSAKTPLSANELLAQQITEEINERANHLEDMRKIGGLKPQQEALLLSDIAAKRHELSRLQV